MHQRQRNCSIPLTLYCGDVQQGQNVAENRETAFIADFTYDLDWSVITSVDFGLCYNETSSLRDDLVRRWIKGICDSPISNLFASVLVPGPDNFNAADGRALYVPDFLTINPELAASDPGY
ncbi:MAG: hypothetical protein ACNYPE_11675 [Candidatus Azotimanducaceae bacterium WSBS_2022_MAG_OTU7]